MKRKIYSGEINFVTLTVVDWIDVFTRRLYCEFIIENLYYCQKEKGLAIYAYVLMTNHLHLVLLAQQGELGNILRDFKTYTSKKLFEMIKTNPRESRKDWMLNIFMQRGTENNLNRKHQFWQNGNYPVAVYSENVIQQKIDYIHQNPVRSGFVNSPEKYHYSSANPFSPLEMDA
ncbi:MAG TPA: transposase [Balneolaceae bacterium]|nr:transposase [Balneolaceae bacterium]